MGKTSIEWVRGDDGSDGHTVNPIRARNRETGAVGHFCEKVSPGCTGCYAEAWNKRVRPSGVHLLGTGLAYDVRNRDKVELFLDESKLEEVLRRKKPTRYFWEDMSDLFGEWVLDEWLDRCFAVMALTPQHTHLVLTKRAVRMRDYMMVAESQPCALDGRRDRVGREAMRLQDCRRGDPTLRIPLKWPLPNVWLGVSVERQQEADERIPLLLETRAAVRFISAEPLLGPIDMYAFLAGAQRDECLRILGHGAPAASGLDWVIAGGESGHGARPMHPDWARSLRDQCIAAGVPYFFKQWGAFTPGVNVERHRGIVETATWFADRWLLSYENLADTDGHIDDEPDLYRVGKKTAGRLLDGVEWSQFPEVR